jgi:hypothetical protein
MAKFGGQGGNIDYSDMGKKRDMGSQSGTDLGRKGGSSKSRGIGTTDGGDSSGYSGTIKDTKFREVADASGW